MVVVRWGSPKVCGTSACYIDAGFVCQGLAPFDGGSRSAGHGCVDEPSRQRGPQWSPGGLSRDCRARRALMVSVVQLFCRQYHPRGVPRALPWRISRRRSGSLMATGGRGGCFGSGGVWWGGLSRSCASTCSQVLLRGRGWAVQCRVVSLVRDGLSRGDPGACRGKGPVVGVLQGCAGGVLEACGWRWGWCAGC